MKKAVMYGAGSIGRGFIGQLFYESGYEVVFIDVNNEIVNALNCNREYKIRFISDNGNKEMIVRQVRAVNGRDTASVIGEICTADIVATAVGADILPRIAGILAEGIKMRWQIGNMTPLNIIICENLLNADTFLKNKIIEILANEELVAQTTGFVQASIGRMVPVMAAQGADSDILGINVEEYNLLPVDRKGFIGEIPEIKYMQLSDQFEQHIHCKLYIHNMGHAACAYLGALKGYKYIWEAVSDNEITMIVRKAMNDSGLAISREYSLPDDNFSNYISSLISRFANRQLGDTISRVGRDLRRKLSPDDRLIGAIRLCEDHNIYPGSHIKGVAAALCFKDSQHGIQEFKSVEEILTNLCKLNKYENVYSAVVKELELQRKNPRGFFHEYAV